MSKYVKNVKLSKNKSKVRLFKANERNKILFKTIILKNHIKITILLIINNKCLDEYNIYGLARNLYNVF